MIQGFKQQRRKIESGLLIRHCERKRSNPPCRAKKESWIASRSLSSGHSRDQLARSDV